MKTKAALVQEIRRQLAVTREIYDETRASREEYLRIAVEQQAYARMIDIVRDAGTHLLLFGQAHFVLEGNANLARATFADIATWMSYFDAAGSAALTSHNMDSLLEPVLCMLLANDDSSLERVTAREWGRVKIYPNEYGARFARDLIGFLRPTGATLETTRPSIPTKLLFAPYDALLDCIANNDSDSFEVHRARLEAAYLDRKRRRDSALNWYGYGKLSQGCTFDALGTAICRIAVRHGLRVDADTPLYPGVFIRGMS